MPLVGISATGKRDLYQFSATGVTKRWVQRSLISSRGKRALAPRTTSRSVSFCRAAKASLCGTLERMLLDHRRSAPCTAAFSIIPSSTSTHEGLPAPPHRRAGRRRRSNRACQVKLLGLVVRIAATSERQIQVYPVSFQSFANCSAVAGNSRIKMGVAGCAVASNTPRATQRRCTTHRNDG
jgi:hypothetical protein